MIVAPGGKPIIFFPMMALLEPGEEERMVERLTAALRSGAWDAEHGHLRTQDSFDGALRLVISEAP